MATRRVVTVPGMGEHRNPIPHGVVLGNLLLPSVIGGQDPNNPGANNTPESQVAYAFWKMQQIVEAAGGSLANVGKITVYLKDFSHRELVNREWLRLFPDEGDRPARHVMRADLGEKVYIQLDVIAMV